VAPSQKDRTGDDAGRDAERAPDRLVAGFDSCCPPLAGLQAWEMLDGMRRPGEGAA
jgi:hypothetical protein